MLLKCFRGEASVPSSVPPHLRPSPHSGPHCFHPIFYSIAARPPSLTPPTTHPHPIHHEPHHWLPPHPPGRPRVARVHSHENPQRGSTRTHRPRNPRRSPLAPPALQRQHARRTPPLGRILLRPRRHRPSPHRRRLPKNLVFITQYSAPPAHARHAQAHPQIRIHAAPPPSPPSASRSAPAPSKAPPLPLSPLPHPPHAGTQTM